MRKRRLSDSNSRKNETKIRTRMVLISHSNSRNMEKVEMIKTMSRQSNNRSMTQASAENTWLMRQDSLVAEDLMVRMNMGKTEANLKTKREDK